MCVCEAVRVIHLLDRVECVSWKKIRMNGRKRKRERRREGNMYVFFVFLFLVSNTGEDQKRKSVVGRCQPSYFIPSQRHRDTCRMSTRKCHAKAKGKDRAFDWPMDQGLKCKSAKFFPFFPV